MDQQVKARLVYELDEYYKEGDDAIGECPLYIFQIIERDIELVDQLLRKEMNSALQRVFNQLPNYWKDVTLEQLDEIAGERETWFSPTLPLEYNIE